jgi:deoxycytidylate deaminase
MNQKWDRRMMGLARHIATEWGQDPSTRCGAVVAQGKNVIALGYNGFPPGVDDTQDRLLARDTRLAMGCDPNRCGTFRTYSLCGPLARRFQHDP